MASRTHKEKLREDLKNAKDKSKKLKDAVIELTNQRKKFKNNFRGPFLAVLNKRLSACQDNLCRVNRDIAKIKDAISFEILSDKIKLVNDENSCHATFSSRSQALDFESLVYSVHGKNFQVIWETAGTYRAVHLDGKWYFVLSPNTYTYEVLLSNGPTKAKKKDSKVGK